MRADVRAARHALAGLAIVAAGCITPPAPKPRISFPFWSVREARGTKVGCAQVIAWVSKSGKDGLGVSVQVASPEADCPVSIDEASVETSSLSVNASPLPPSRTVAKGEVVRAYLPFLFDNEAAWNRGDLEAKLVLHVTAGGEGRELQVPMIQKPYSFLREPATTSTAVPTVQKIDLKRLDAPPAPTPAATTPATTPPAEPPQVMP